VSVGCIRKLNVGLFNHQQADRHRDETEDVISESLHVNPFKENRAVARQATRYATPPSNTPWGRSINQYWAVAKVAYMIPKNHRRPATPANHQKHRPTSDRSK